MPLVKEYTRAGSNPVARTTLLLSYWDCPVKTTFLLRQVSFYLTQLLR